MLVHRRHRRSHRHLNMKSPTAAAVVLVALLSVAQARPEGMPAMTEATETPTPNPTSMDTTPHAASHEDSSSSEEDKNITVLAKTAALCPPQQPELQAIETECLSAVDPSCLSNHESSMKSSIEVTTEMPANPSSTDASHASGEQCKTICNYHQCVLEKLEVLDSTGKPHKTLLSNWIANNVTDERQREQLQHKLSQCPSFLPDGSYLSPDDSKSEEEADDSQRTTSNAKYCKDAKTFIHGLFDIECPIIKLL